MGRSTHPCDGTLDRGHVPAAEIRFVAGHDRLASPNRAGNDEGMTPARQSDSKAASPIARLVREHAGPLYQLACRFCGNPDEADDLVQEVFLQAMRGWDDFRGDASERTWLYRIAARACQRMHRKRAGEPGTIGSLDELLPFGEPLIAAIPAEQDDVQQQQIRAEAIERVEREIAELPDEFRVPLLLKELVGMSTAEVAEVLELEPNTVRSRVHRARLKLRAAVDSAVPRGVGVAPPAAYSEKTCLDLLDAKQDALDRGVPFDSAIICQRCKSVFATLDLTQDACRSISKGELPGDLRKRLLDRLTLEKT